MKAGGKGVGPPAWGQSLIAFADDAVPRPVTRMVARWHALRVRRHGRERSRRGHTIAADGSGLSQATDSIGAIGAISWR